MNFQISNFKFQIRQGYTLIELMVVLAIMGFIAAVAFYGLRNYNNAQQVINTQKDFVNLLRATQNKVTNGADGSPVKTVDVPMSLSLPVGINVTNNRTGNGITICFANSNLISFDSTNVLYQCGACSSGSDYFLCDDVTNSKILGGVTFSFSNGSTIKTVTIEGSNMTINRIYAN
ncbi:type II secretion system protein [Candidatus Gottesmanbacteria bacterium]|nr:type II secretion system protein [Candidatus Gottesmanbacteria bacterium]